MATIDEEIELLTGGSSGDIVAESQFLQGSTPSNERLKQIKEAKEFNRPVTAAALGAARGLTLGLSDVAAAGLGQRQFVEKIKQYNPIVSGAADIGSMVASVVSGVGILPTLGKAAVKGAGKVGASKVLSLAAREAAEGAASAVGQAVSDVALTPKQLSADQVASHLLASGGIGALLGGGTSVIFSSVGKGVGSVGKMFKKPAAEVTQEGAQAVTTKATKDAAKLSDNFLITDIKPTSDEVKQAAKELGIADSLTPGFSTENKTAQMLERSLTYRPTYAGQVVTESYDDIAKGIQSALQNNTLGKVTKETELALGGRIKQGLKNIFEQRKDYFNDIYGALKLEQKAIKFAPEESQVLLKNLSRNFKSLETELSPAFGQALKKVTRVLKGKRVSTIDDVVRISRSLGDDAFRAGLNTTDAQMIYRLKDSVDRAVERSALRSAIGIAKNPAEARSIAKNFVQAKLRINKEYAQVMGLVKDIGEISGIKTRKRGLNEFIKAIDAVPNEKLSAAFVKRNIGDAESLKFIRDTFPEQFDLMISAHQANVVKNSMTSDGTFSTLKFLNQFNRLPKETAEILFGFDGVRTVQNVQKVLAAAPKNFNPSGTSAGIAFNDLTLTNFIPNNVADFAKLAFLRRIAENANTAKKADKVLNKLGFLADNTVEGAVSRNRKTIFKEIEQFLEKSAPGVGVGGAAAGQSFLSTPEQTEKVIDEISMLTENPNALMARISEKTEALNQYSPDVAMSVANQTLEAVSFLRDKMPKPTLPPDMFGKRKPTFSDYEISKFQRYVRAVQNPLSVVSDMSAGKLSPQAIEAVQVVYPEIYEEMREAAFNMTAKQSAELSYTQKVQLSMFLGVPLTNSMNSQTVQNIQTRADGSEKTKTASQSQRLANIAKASQTGFQRVESTI